MEQIRDAILAGDRTPETYESIPVPESYRGATVRKDEVDMFEGLASRDKDPRRSLHIDEVPVPDVLRFERELLDYLGRNTSVLSDLREKNVLSDDIVSALDAGVDAFKQEFQTGEGKPLASVGTEQFEATDAADVNQEKIVKAKR